MKKTLGFVALLILVLIIAIVLTRGNQTTTNLNLVGIVQSCKDGEQKVKDCVSQIAALDTKLFSCELNETNKIFIFKDVMQHPDQMIWPTYTESGVLQCYLLGGIGGSGNGQCSTEVNQISKDLEDVCELADAQDFLERTIELLD